MSEKRRYNIKSILINSVWIMLGIGTTTLLVAAINKKDNNYCKKIYITIKGVQNNFFIDKGDVKRMLEKMNLGTLEGKSITNFNLSGMEALLKKNEWIKNAELYFDNNDVLRINIMEREPVARIFNSAGQSFYIDSSRAILPLSNKFSARLPVFTNFPALNNSLTNTDSNFLTEIKNISLYISAHPFWMAQIEQVDITPERSFEMIPKIGNQVIVFGSADNYEEKFDNLLLFYKNVQSKVGWNKYSKINVSYKNEVIAVKRDAAEVKMDSLKTIQLMKLLVANAQKEVNDSTRSIQLAQPKDDNTIPFARSSDDKAFRNQLFNHDDSISKYDSKAASPAILKASAPAGAVYTDILASQPPSNESHSGEKPISVNLKKQKLKPIIKKPEVVPEKQPKAVMPPKNDY